MSPAGIITTWAGDGQFDHNIFDSAGDGGSATSALINLPDGLATDAAGDLFIADDLRGRVREVTAAGSTLPAAVSISGTKSEFTSQPEDNGIYTDSQWFRIR